MKTLKYGLIAIASLSLMATSCRKKGCTDSTAFNYSDEAKKDDGTCKYNNQVTLQFTQSFNDENVTAGDYNQFKFTNAFGTKIAIERLRYSISDVSFFKADGDSVHVEMGHLIDLADATTLMHELSEKIDPVEYVGFSFIYGLTPDRNINENFPEWNAVNWGWPQPLGLGFHQLQFDGEFIKTDGDTTGFNFHNGSNTQDPNDPSSAEPNYVYVRFDNNIEMNEDRTIEIGMQIDQWFENPNLWDLNVLGTNLMGNKAAQLDISENAGNVFEIVGVE
ncbi:MAG: MbnP family protein [Crocinitomicaceae bacterium]